MIEKTKKNRKCWLWEGRDETFNLRIREFNKIASKEYKDIYY